MFSLRERHTYSLKAATLTYRYLVPGDSAFIKEENEHYYPPRPPRFLSNLSIRLHTRCRNHFLSASFHCTPTYSQSCPPFHHFLSSSSFFHHFWVSSLLYSLILLYFSMIPPHIAEDGQGMLHVHVCAQPTMTCFTILSKTLLWCC